MKTKDPGIGLRTESTTVDRRPLWLELWMCSPMPSLLAFASRSYLLRAILEKTLFRLVGLLLRSKAVRIHFPLGFSLTTRFPEDKGWECFVALNNYEVGLVDLFRSMSLEGATVFDLGANLGWHTLTLATLVGDGGRVYAFEPQPNIFSRLKAHLELNPRLEKRISVYRLAISDGAGTLRLHVSSQGPHGLASAALPTGSLTDRQSISVDCITLDEFWSQVGRPKVSLIKIDIEGLELIAIRGGQDLIERDRPILVFEVNFEAAKAANWDPKEAMELLAAKFEYRFLRIPMAWGKAVSIDSHSQIRHGDTLVAIRRD